MRTFQYLLCALAVVLSTFAQAQDSKIQLRDFTPKYKIDTFHLMGEPASVKRRVVEALRLEGIKSAFWDEASGVLTVQYNHQLTGLSSIKVWFMTETPAFRSAEIPEEPYNTLADCCCTKTFVHFKK